jgi:hypothetical protein
VVAGPITNLTLAEAGYTVSGTVTVNGAAPTRSAAYCAVSGNVNDSLGVVTFTDPVRGYSTAYTMTCTTTATGFTWSLNLPPGTYDVRVTRGTYATQAGVNLLGVDYLAQGGVVVSGPISNLTLAEVGYTVSGSVTVNGAAPTRSAAYCAVSGNVNDSLGVITFNDAARGYTASYTMTCTTTAAGFTYSLTLPPGTYDVRVTRGTYATQAGVNLLAVNYLAQERVAIAGPISNLTLAEAGYTVSGTVTVNGATPSRSAAYCAVSGNVNDSLGVVTFTDPVRGYSTAYTMTCTTTASGFTFSVVLPPGTYDVRVTRGTYATQAGVNLLGVDYLAAAKLRVP